MGALAAAFAATAVARRATDLCWRIIPPPDPADDRSVSTQRTAGLIKVTVDRLAERATSQCRRACGALGFLSLSRLVDYQGLALAFNTAGGDNQMILLDAAWSMATGTDYEPHPCAHRTSWTCARHGPMVG